jgi:hypothetical protein
MRNTNLAWVLFAALLPLSFWETAEGSQIGKPSYNLIQDEGGSLARRSTLNFTGSAVSCSDSAGTTVCDFTGGGGGGAGAPNTTASFTSQTAVTITDNLGTSAKIAQCRDSSNVVLQPNSITITNSNTTTIGFSVAQTGTCVVNGTQGSGVSVVSKTTSFTAGSGENILLCDASVGAVTATLPGTATAGVGRQYTLKKTDASVNACIWDGDLAETIDGSATQSITVRFQSLTVVSDGSQWWII